MVDCSGRIALGVGSVIPKYVVRELPSKGQKEILLLGDLVSAFTTVRNQGGNLKLPNLTKRVHDLLQLLS